MSRRQAREVALKVLFQVDLVGGDARQGLEYLCAEEGLDGEDAAFAAGLVEGVLRRQREIDADIAAYSRDWRLHRIGGVERSILRLAIYEIRWAGEVPRSVAANEAVELAKTFAGEESGRFVNGIVGQLIRDLEVREGGGEGRDG
ncbi:MAG: transcription antitermination factor NusB [Clostridia bacterium]|nr:transcription antitermination factor NusB [Clostridia bacterium]